MSAATKKRLLLVVIDGLGSRAMRRAIDDGDAPTIAAVLANGGSFGAAVSPYPSLTPVCLATIATGQLPDRHRIPSLSWLHRGERRFVEYGSSFKAASVAGMSRTVEDVMLNLNHVHLSASTPTFFETVEDLGVPAASINYLVFRGRTRHTMKYTTVGRVARRARQFDALYGPSYFYLGELFGHPQPRALPQVGLKGISDWSAAHIARRLMLRSDARFVLLYLGQHDKAAHKAGPEETREAVRVADRSIKRVIEALGGLERFTDTCSLLVCADHGQTSVWPGQQHTLEQQFDDVSLFRGGRKSQWDESDVAICPSNRFAMVYRLREQAPSAAALASRLVAAPACDVVAYRDGPSITALRGEARLTMTPTTGSAHGSGDVVRVPGAGSWTMQGDLAALDLQRDAVTVRNGSYPGAVRRIAALLSCGNAGDIAVSATVGWEFTDIAGQYHGGGSHGSLHELDSTAPIVSLGLKHPTAEEGHLPGLEIVHDMVVGHFGAGR